MYLRVCVYPILCVIAPKTLTKLSLRSRSDTWDYLRPPKSPNSPGQSPGSLRRMTLTVRKYILCVTATAKPSILAYLTQLYIKLMVVKSQ